MKSQVDPVRFAEIEQALVAAVNGPDSDSPKRKELSSKLKRLENRALAYLDCRALAGSSPALIWQPEEKTVTNSIHSEWGREVNQQQNLITLLRLLRRKLRARREFSTLQMRVNDCKRLFGAVSGRLIADLGEDDWETICENLPASNSRQRLMSTWQQMRWAWKEGTGLSVVSVRWSKIKPPTRTRAVFVPTQSDLDKILGQLLHNNSCGPAVYVAVLLAAFFGLRASECAHLKLGHLQFSRQLEVIVVRGKRRKTRIVAELEVPETVRRFLLEIYGHRIQAEASNPMAYFLLDKSGRPLTRARILRVFQKAALAAGVVAPSECRELNFHRLRHFCANRLLALGVPLSEVRDYLGHASADTTIETYVHNLGLLDPIDSSIDRILDHWVNWVSIRWLADHLA